MICIKDNPKGAEILTDYCASKLDPGRASELGTHLEQCAECRELVEAQKTVWEMLEVWKPVEVSPDFDAKLYARIAQDNTEPAWKRWFLRILQPAEPGVFWKPVAAVAAMGAVLSLALVVHAPFAAHPVAGDAAPQAQVQSHSDKIDVEQVEQALDDLDMLTPVGQSPTGRM
jgi:anti-sigma factor RsiW